MSGVQEIFSKCVERMNSNTNNSFLLILSNVPNNSGDRFQSLKF